MATPLHLLMVEDSEDDARLILRELRRGGYEPIHTRVMTPEAMRAALERQPWNVVTSDHIMPHFSATAALALTKECQPDLPFIIVSGEIDLNLAVSLMKAGAQDYIQKHELARLTPAIERELREVEVRRERQQAESALRESEERYRRITQAVTDYIYSVRVENGRVVETRHGPGCVAVTGYTSEEFSANPYLWISMVADEDRPLVEEQAQRVLTGEGAVPLEHRIWRKDATQRWVRNTPVPHHTEQGQLLSYDGLIQDVTDRKRAERSLHTQRDITLALNIASSLETGLRLCLEAAIRISDMDSGGFYLVNENSGAVDLACHQGLSPEFIASVSHFDAQARNAQIVMAGQPIYTEHLRLGTPMDAIHRREGLHAVAVIPILFENRVIGCLNLASHTQDEVPPFARDALETITAQIGNAIARLKAETGSRENIERLRQITSSLREAVWLRDIRTLEVLYVNPAYETIWGRSCESFYQNPTSFIEAIWPEDKERVMEAIKQQSQGIWFNQEYRITRPDGSLRWVWGRTFPVHNAAGKAYRVVAIAEDITERKLTERKFSATQALLQASIEQSPIPMVVAAPDGTVTIFNPACAEILGIVDEPKTKTGINIFTMQRSWQDLDAEGNPILPEAAPLALALQGKATRGKEMRVRRKDGTERWEVVNGVPIYDKDDTLIAGCIIFPDITERKRAEAALRESELRFRTVVEEALDSIVIVDEQGRIAAWNQTMEALMGIPAADALHKPAWDVQFQLRPEAQRTPAFYQMLKSAIQEVLQTGQAPWIGQVTEREHVRPDGSRVLLEARDTVIQTEKGFMIVGVSNDITERKRAEAALAERMQFETMLSDLSTTLANLPTGEVDQEIVRGLQRVVEFLGVDRGGLMELTAEPDGLRVTFSYAAPGIEVALPFLSASEFPWFIEKQRQGETLIAENPAAAPNEAAREKDFCRKAGVKSVVSIPITVGGTVWGAITFVAFRQARAWPLELVSRLKLIGEVFANALERKRAAEEIQQLNTALEQRVKERTVQLEAINKELEAFSFSVSHDLRAPLRAIEGFSTALEDDYTDDLDEDGRHYLQRIRSATQRMNNSIDGLLELARLTRSELAFETVDLSASARAIADELRKNAPERQVEWVITDGLTANADARLMRTVLENLLDNAWKFTSKRTQARIEFGAVNQPDGTRAYFVRDNGAGFDPAYAEKAFHAFQRLHTAKEFPGTGIGLATVQRIIHRHGGQVWAEAKVDEGATFYFTL